MLFGGGVNMDEQLERLQMEYFDKLARLAQETYAKLTEIQIEYTEACSRVRKAKLEREYYDQISAVLRSNLKNLN